MTDQPLTEQEVRAMETRVMSIGCTYYDYRQLMDSHELLRQRRAAKEEPARMTDEPLTEQEVRALYLKYLSPKHTEVCLLCKDWLRLKQQLAEAERELADIEREAADYKAGQTEALAQLAQARDALERAREFRRVDAALEHKPHVTEDDHTRTESWRFADGTAYSEDEYSERLLAYEKAGAALDDALVALEKGNA